MLVAIRRGGWSGIAHADRHRGQLRSNAAGFKENHKVRGIGLLGKHRRGAGNSRSDRNRAAIFKFGAAQAIINSTGE